MRQRDLLMPAQWADNGCMNDRPRALHLKACRFGVTVLKVNVVCGKARDYVRQNRRQCHKPGYKKAFVTVTQDSKIEYFEGA